MGRIYNENIGTFAGAWDILIQKPLDTRTVVQNKTDLTTADTWKSSDDRYYHYKGMTVTVIEDNTIYVYMGESGSTTDVVDASKWVLCSGSSMKVENLEALNAVAAPVKGSIAYVQDIDKFYSYTDNGWKLFGSARGIIQVASVDDLATVELDETEQGVIAYVSGEDRYYYNITGTSAWKKLNTIGAIRVVNTYADLASLDVKDDEIGTLAYVKDVDYYYAYTASGTWKKYYLSTIVTDDTAPENTDALWLDTSLESDWDDANTLDSIKASIKTLQTAVIKLQNIATYGVLAGDATTSGLEEIYTEADAVEPDDALTHYDDEVTEIEPTKVDGLYVTVSHIKIKADTSSNFNSNKQNLIDGEIVYLTNVNKIAVYYNGTLHATGSSSSEEGSGLSLELLQALSLDYLMFTDGDNKYRIEVRDGKAVAVPYNTNTTAVGSVNGTWGVYINYLLNINSVYCGASGSDDCLCSHNYVELANGSDSDINLNGLYLLYTDGTKENSSDVGYIWKYLALTGVIKAGSTFVIRGARCNTDKASMIKVQGYDMIWEDSGTPITFSLTASSFYLCAGDSFTSLLETSSLNNPWNKDESKRLTGYIDSVGFGTNAVGEGSTSVTPSVGTTPMTNWNSILFVRWFMLDPSKQANKAYTARKTNTLWTYINLDKQTTRTMVSKVAKEYLYYFPDDAKIKFAPLPSSGNKDFFTNKTKFDSNKPNMVNITFGILATDNGSGATRCFNWVSVGYYDEYLSYKKATDTTWTTVESIRDGDYTDFRNEHYKRFRWCTSYGEWVTTHKVIISGLTAGTYQYRVGRIDDTLYTSDVMTFTVKADENVSSFSFIQTTDQQGFNWLEYQVWKKAAYYISTNETGYDFTINTGDITLSGNRVNEWMDYYDGRQYLRNKEEMFTIGNNDLCGHNSTELTDGNDASSKYNHVNVLRYFTFELDPNNPNYQVSWDGEDRPIYSLYSFNYGAFHFICLNSEIAQASSKTYKGWASETALGDSTFAEAANAKIEDWLLKDLQIWKSTSGTPSGCSKAIVYMHEMPFTMTTWTILNGTGARAGSHLNTLNSRGQYRFSRLFKQYGIRMVMGGHKHTYTISKPIYDAPDNYILSSHTVNGDVSLLNNTVTTALSRMPVIQVTDSSSIPTSDSFARYEKVETINAPTYVMSQATGYKLISNKELPSGDAYTISWLLSYFKATLNAESPKENYHQHYPMYIRYNLTTSRIEVIANQINNIWDITYTSDPTKDSAVFDINNQLTDISSTEMTLSLIRSEDKTAYNITDTTKYTINL